MNVENLKFHCDLIRKENYKTTTRWVLILSSKNFTKILKIDDFFKIYPLDGFDTDIEVDDEDSNVLSPFIDRIKRLKTVNGLSGRYYYLLQAKMISIYEERMRVPGSRIIIIDILKDLMNLYSV